MNEFKRAREEYEATPIPSELGERVQAGIRQGRAASQSGARRKNWGRTVGTFAACFALLLGGLNLSPTFAAAAADVPVLGGLFQVLTVRSYETDKDQVHYDVSVPGLEAEGELAQQVNDQIQSCVEKHLAEAEQAWEEYHEAFIATGGTEEEWSQRDMDIIVDYEVKSQSDTTVSFVVNLFQGSFDAYNQQYYYNLNIAEDRDITLEELLGEHWVELCNTAVQAWIDADETGLFFSAEQGGFSTVDADTDFYINQEGTPVLAFQPYTIAAGAAGTVEIPVTE